MAGNAARPRPQAHSGDSAGDERARRERSEFGGLTIRRLLARDAFCSVWLTEPLDEGFADTCVKAFPAAHFRALDAYDRFRKGLSFWRGMGGAVVDLYDCGETDNDFFMVMRYLPDGSAADQLARDDWLAAHLREFAGDFAAALCDVHAGAGAHGNLKPSNVFVLRGKHVLLSDFSMPLWLDEFEKGCGVLGSRLLHLYRSPEQRENLRDFDTRSDVYTYGLILWRCCSGAEPPADGRPPDPSGLAWPGRLGAAVERCLALDRRKRPADGLQLLEMVSEGTPRGRPDAHGASDTAAAPAEPPSPGAPDVARLLHTAKDRVEKGLLEEALDTLESLPRRTSGVQELLNEIEARHRACQKLADEAVRLAGMGETEAALETVGEAEKLWRKCDTIVSVKAELVGAAAKEGSSVPGALSGPLQSALDAGQYDTARAVLENMVRQGPVTEELGRAIRQFKRERVRTAFLGNVRTAKRLYLQGYRKEAGEQWEEAARWLPSGPHRERLRRIAGAARRGKLRVAVERAQLDRAGTQARARKAEPPPADAPPPEGSARYREAVAHQADDAARPAHVPKGAAPRAPEPSAPPGRRALIVALAALGAFVAAVGALLLVLR